MEPLHTTTIMIVPGIMVAPDANIQLALSTIWISSKIALEAQRAVGEGEREAV
jgi:hypothetical protein